MDYIELRKCRLCKSKNIKKNIFSKPFYLSNLNKNLNINYSLCIDCQYIFQSSYVGDAFLNNYYQNSPMFRNFDATIYDLKSIKRQIDFLKRNIDFKKISSCLEIGAHTGHFLKQIKFLFNTKIYYDELSEEALKILASIPDFDKFKKTNDKVDLIILRHVLEHVNDLDGFVDYIDKSLNEQGILFIEVPDWSILDSHTDAFIFEHLSHFNDKCLIDFFRRKGFIIMAIERAINKDDPSTPNRVLRLIFSRINLPLFKDPNFIDHFNSYFHKKHDSGRLKLNKIYSKIGKKKPVGFFPASNLSFSAVMESDIEKINLIGYFDSDKKKEGKDFLGYKVFSPQELKNLNPEVIFIFSEAYEPEIRDLFKKMKYDPIIYSYSKIYDFNY